VSRLWGPTCDGADLIFSNVQLPELQIGDWVIFQVCKRRRFYHFLIYNFTLFINYYVREWVRIQCVLQRNSMAIHDQSNSTRLLMRIGSYNYNISLNMFSLF
jgi:hypothetical protein